MSFLYHEIQYINQISFRLDRFKQKDRLQWTFRCPYCGDSESKPNKTSGYIYEGDKHLFFTCYKCHVNADFPEFLRFMDQEVYRQFITERFRETRKGRRDSEDEKDISFLNDLQFRVLPFVAKKKEDATRDDPLLAMTTLKKLEDDHQAVRYLKARGIPKNKWSEFFYTSKLDWFCGLDQKKPEPRVVLYCKGIDGKAFAVIGRLIPGYYGLRYKIHRLSGDLPLIYGLNSADLTKRIFVVEGSFDSLFLPNSVAICSSHLHAIKNILIQHGVQEIPPITLVYDNEKRNPRIVSLMLKAVNLRYQVCVWPSNVRGKDINDIVSSGADVQSMIEENTYSGLEAKRRIKTWKRCDLEEFARRPSK